MKKSLVLACLISVIAASSFAQSAPARTPTEAGARLVAERDAAWLKAHPGTATVKEPMALHDAKHVKPAKHVKHIQHVKSAMHKTKKAA